LPSQKTWAVVGMVAGGVLVLYLCYAAYQRTHNQPTIGNTLMNQFKQGEQKYLNSFTRDSQPTPGPGPVPPVGTQ